MEPIVCDQGRCNASALVKIHNVKGDTLDFCGHHFNVSRSLLELQGFSINTDHRLDGQRFEVIPEKNIAAVTSGTVAPTWGSQVPPDDDPEFCGGGVGFVD